MIKETVLIRNVDSTDEKMISVKTVYENISKEANRGCGLYYEIYESRLIGLLLDYLTKLSDPDAEKLQSYAESQGTKVDDKTYSNALEAERECRAEIYRDQM